MPAVARRLIFTIDAIDHTQPGSQAHCGENNCSSAQYRPACCLDSITNTPFILTNREACQSLGIRHTRTKPRHAWTNGFVERLQGTILHEHWRAAFRRRYFTARPQLDRSLQRYLAF